MLARRLGLARTVLILLSLAWLVVVLFLRPELRPAYRVAVGVYWVLFAVFVLARTKTLTWTGYAGLFAVCVLGSVAVGLLDHHLGTGVGVGKAFGGVDSAGAQVALASVVEESAKLVPLVLLVLVAAHRVQKFSTVDWLLAGLACGLGFTVVEEAGRRVAYLTSTSPFKSLYLVDADGDGLPDEFVTFGLFGAKHGFVEVADVTYAGHHVQTALVAVGFTIALWQAGHGYQAGYGGRSVRPVTRAAAVALPLLVFRDDAGRPCGVQRRQQDVGVELRRVDEPLVPAGWMHLWSVATGQGHGRGALLVAAFVVALLVDSPGSADTATPRSWGPSGPSRATGTGAWPAGSRGGDPDGPWWSGRWWGDRGGPRSGRRASAWTGMWGGLPPKRWT